ncbi:leucine--tRNA ligase [Candidatus Nomurabacteria bacterium]|nr:leucine--tRNA ligase [Candidatus Nomurabacteria bacterium]
MTSPENGKKYDHKTIEQKWQKEWQEEGVYKTEENSNKPKQFILDMFPYPSGEGLHVGHPRGYIATDVYSRKKRMEGFNILHPMGWDAFGLPAENFAIKNKVHPRVAVEKNIARFKEQLSIIGFDYDWSREINTTDQNFYKWTQWVFLQMYKKGLAFESNEPVNWCPKDKTILANEDVEPDGTCERCGTKVEKKPIRQWVLKITDYADRLLSDLDKLPRWPEGVKEAQRNWIGRKEGIIISHKVQDSDIVLESFSAYPAWLYADTFLVIAPEHPLVKKLIEDNSKKLEIEKFIEEVKNTPEIERGSLNKEKKGIFTGKYVLDPIKNGDKMPIWIANFAMMGFGTGIIRCSSHDVRDYEFAKKYDLPLKEVVETGKDKPADAHTNEGLLKDSGPFSGKLITENLIEEMKNYFVSEGYGKKTVSYKIKDWVFSRQRYWGEPIPIIHCEKCGVVPVPERDLPVLLPEVENYEPTDTAESPLATIESWVNTKCPSCGENAKRETNTMPQWAGSSWYYLRYIDPQNDISLVDLKKEKDWMPVDVYVGGDHATRHLIYARFWHKFLFDIGVVSTEEPFPRLEFLGFILAEDGRKMSKRWGNVINPDDVVKNFGADAFRLYEMFIGPFEGTVPWSTNGLVGTYRFVEKIWSVSQKSFSNETKTLLKNLLHKTIKKVTEDIEEFKFNTAVSSLMILVNEIYKSEISKEDFKILLQLLAPFAPHITEELWRELGDKESIHLSSWPIYDTSLVIDEEVTIGVQINGKLRDEITIPKDTDKDAIEKATLDLPKVKEYLKDKKIDKIVVVPNRIINIVIS